MKAEVLKKRLDKNQRFDALYLVKQLAIEGVISKSEYQLLMNALLLRNAIAHGFKTTELTQNTVYELIELTRKTGKFESP